MYENDSFEKICALQPYEFEKHCADILGLLGYSEIHLTPSHKDDGVDIWCRRNGQQFAIQCKRYSHATSVTVDQMKALYGSSQPQGAQGIMMTTGKCTLPATEFAKKNGIQIWDGEKFKSEFIHLCHTPPTFREWIKKNYI